MEGIVGGGSTIQKVNKNNHQLTSSRSPLPSLPPSWPAPRTRPRPLRQRGRRPSSRTRWLWTALAQPPLTPPTCSLPTMTTILGGLQMLDTSVETDALLALQILFRACPRRYQYVPARTSLTPVKVSTFASPERASPIGDTITNQVLPRAGLYQFPREAQYL